MPLIACHFNKVGLIYQHQMIKQNVWDSEEGMGIFHFLITLMEQ